MKKMMVNSVAMMFTGLVSLSAFGEEIMPDLTKGERDGVTRELTYNLGPTGLRGWIYTHAPSNLDAAQGRTTTTSRQILVTHVGAKSPASGVVEIDDIILGVGGKRFTDDARKSFGQAITEAEKNENRGILKLSIFRNGKEKEVQLKLAVMGAYSITAPYNCQKSKKILADACKALEKEPLNEDLWGAVNGLALLATGQTMHLTKVRSFARSMAANEVESNNSSTWECGYKNVFLSEYYLLSGDKKVLPGIQALTVKMAKGQSMYGTFGHGFSDLTPSGKLHGSIPAYGPVNQAGLIASLGITLGGKCGAKDPEIGPAIWRGQQFYRYFVGKGSIPYGEHMPWPYHENNGKNALAALLFDVSGNQREAAQFFAKMCTAAYPNREYGHTGQGFSYLWGAMGANVGGPEALAAFMKESQWHLDLVRRCDGSFTYDGQEQYGAGKTDDDTYYGKSSYDGLSPNACYVLTYAIPLKKLSITGKASKKADWLSSDEVRRAIASGRFDRDRETMSLRQLIAALDDWSPIVRSWAAEELAKRPEATQEIPALIKMAEGTNTNMSQGACEALGHIKSREALPVFVRLLKHQDRWLRVKAANALRNMGDASLPVLPGMLQAVVDTVEPLEPIIWEDPVQLTHGELAQALFGGLLKDEAIKGVDRNLLYPAIRAVAKNADGMARGTLSGTFEQLDEKDIKILAPDILAAVRVRAPADTMFGNNIRMSGLKTLVNYKYREGINACVHFAQTQGMHGSEDRTGELMTLLLTYGKAAQPMIPELQKLIVSFNVQVKAGKFPEGELNDRRVTALKEAIKAIQAATTEPEMITIEK